MLSKSALARQVLPEALARQLNVVLLEVDEHHCVFGCTDESDIHLSSNLSAVIGRNVTLRSMSLSAILDHIELTYSKEVETVASVVADVSATMGIELIDEDVEKNDDLTIGVESAETVESAPVIRLVNTIIVDAYRRRASDIHLEPTELGVSLRYRIDGVLLEQSAPPKQLIPALVSRIKILAKLNIAEKRLPQDGRIRLRVDGQELDVRVATAPCIHGESVTMRLLDRRGGGKRLVDLGMSPDDLHQLNQLIHNPHGILLVTGPTGSGKTTTLYAVLEELRSTDRKIITLEDPVEYEVQGTTQIQVMPKIGLDFAEGLRTVLRHDPDVLMVGEIRDRETAAMAIQAALTGHLVISSLHTNDAASALTRLINMGIEPFLVASTVRAIIAQRLVRILCPRCKHKEGKEYKTVGCAECDGQGYRGRMGIFEMLNCDEDVQRLIIQQASSREVARSVRSAGAKSLMDDGIKKVHDGFTTIEEVHRVIGV